MTSAEFRARYRRALPVPPPELDLDLEVFETFDRSDTQRAGLNRATVMFLAEAGLPRDAAPFLSFRNTREYSRIPATYFEIGVTNYGDPICIDTKSGAVVYLNHENEDRPVMMNSSLEALAESLCIYREHLSSGNVRECFSAILAIDPELSRSSFWGVEGVEP